MSQAALSRIEKTLSEICEQQQEICRKIAKLEEASASARAQSAISDDELMRFLDQFRAGEALGEASLGAWIEISDTACVRGGLRTIAQREGMHARLLEARMKELGGSPCFEIPEAVYEKTMARAGDRGVGDAQKLADFMKQFPDIDAALQPIFDIADKLDHDPETQSLLRTIAQDERSTLEFVRDACQQLSS